MNRLSEIRNITNQIYPLRSEIETHTKELAKLRDEIDHYKINCLIKKGRFLCDECSLEQQKEYNCIVLCGDCHKLFHGKLIPQNLVDQQENSDDSI